MAESPQKRSDESRAIYQETVKVAATFWEWRHKLLTLLFSASAGLLAMSAWLLQNEPRWAAGVPLLVAGFVSLALGKLERRNATILQKCYDIGSDVEGELRSNGAIFRYLHDNSTERGRPYTDTLKRIFSLSCVFFFALAGAMFLYTYMNPIQPRT